MAIFKCKMCGGSLEVSEGMTVCECEYCGTSQTLPKTSNEQPLNMVNRTNHFRQQCEFDKAAEEEPFDVFICCKESDENGKRTPDSILAQELYYQLEREGFKVFFSRITLEDKLGTDYEPYVLAALNSARVMVVVGTKPEYLNDVWVKKEWSRYIVLMKEERCRTLISAYKDMNPYYLPDALSAFQVWDMSMPGSMQNLIRCINKTAKTETEVKAVFQQSLLKNSEKKIEELKAEELVKQQPELSPEEKKKRCAKRNKIISCVSVAAVILAITGGIVGNNIHKSNMYDEAVSDFESGDYKNAYKNFSQLKKYKNSADYLTKPEMALYTSSVGDIVTFGNYSWYVINKTNDGCTLLCENIVAKKEFNEYHEDYEYITWADCTLRYWLNNDFYNEFSDYEKAMIVKTKNSTPDNLEYCTYGGIDTEDHIYLLSLDEAENVSEDIRNIGFWWWLRSPGSFQFCISKVLNYGSLDNSGNSELDKGGVRPALTLKFD